MSTMDIVSALARIGGASPQSPIAVFKSNTPGRLDCVFANTLRTQQLIRSRAPGLVGVFHGGMHRAVVRETLQAHLRAAER